MISQSKRSVGILGSTMAAALFALWPSPAQAGYGDNRIRPPGSHHQNSKRQAKPKPRAGARSTGGAGSSATRSTSAPSR
jgi:hypothetical protein